LLLIHWLSNHRPICGFFALGYLAYVTFSHDMMQRPAHWAQAQLGFRTWNKIIFAIGAPLLVTFTAWLLIRLRRHPARNVALVYLAFSLAFTITAFFTLLQVNIEMVHLPQYAIFAALLFPLTLRYADTMILATAGGIIDEGYQYFVLHAHWGVYFDFNDVILNTIGAGCGVVALFVLHPDVHEKKLPAESMIPRWLIPMSALLILGCGLGLAAAGIIRATAQTDPMQWTIALRRGDLPSTFWLKTSQGVAYHEVQVLPGLIATILLISLFGALDGFRPGGRHFAKCRFGT